MMVSSSSAKYLERLLDLVRTLRSPGGCPWDREQGKKDIARYLLEEAYEAVDAIEEEASDNLREELGDLLFHIVFLARMAEEEGEFSFDDVLVGIVEKMVRRHPHVFGNVAAAGISDIKANWELIKKKEKESRGVSSCLRRFEMAPRSLPALMKAQKIGKEAAKAGFDWPNTEEVLKKVAEELDELKNAMKTGRTDLISGEMGDLLFSLVNLCRFLEVDAEGSLRGALNKFAKRFTALEEELHKEGKTPEEATLAEMDRLWNEIKTK